MEAEYLFRRKPKKVEHVHTANRTICTEIPVPESMEIIERSIKNEPWSMNNQLYAVWDHASGYNVCDKWGNKWIDMSSGIFVTNAGHGNPDMIEALEKMIRKPMLNSYYYYLEERSLLAEQLLLLPGRTLIAGRTACENGASGHGQGVPAHDRRGDDGVCVEIMQDAWD